MCIAKRLGACALLVALVSCGGGGGGGSSSPSVNNSQANVSASNAAVFANDVATAVIVAVSTRVGPDTSFPQMDFLIGGGSMNFPAPGLGGNVTGTGTFSNFSRSAGLAVTGQVTVTSGAYGASAIDNLHFSTSGLSYSPAGLVLSGTVDLVWSFPGGGVAEYTITLNGTASSGGNPVAVVENFVVDSTLSAGQESVTVSGKLTDAAQGFVTVSTTTPITVNEPGGIASGVVVVTGTTTKGTITFTGGGSATVVISPI